MVKITIQKVSYPSGGYSYLVKKNGKIYANERYKSNALAIKKKLKK